MAELELDMELDVISGFTSTNARSFGLNVFRLGFTAGNGIGGALGK